MKKLFLIITVLAMLLLVSCNDTGNSSGSQGGDGTTQGSYDPTKPLIWNPETDVYVISSAGDARTQLISDMFTELTGNVLMPSSDANEKNAHELVIGQSSRPISQAAYHLLDRNMTEDEDAEGYVVLVQDGSVAVAYSSDAAYNEAINAFYENCCVPNYYADNGPVFWDFYSLSLRAEENRDKMYAEGFANLEKKLTAAGATNAAEIAKGVKTYYSLLSTDLIYWLTDLYDPETGGFYHCNSARDNFGFLPDLESTNQTFLTLDRGGMFSPALGATLESGNADLPEFIIEPLAEWIKGLQDPETGFFYHPQWGSTIGTARRGRDLDNAVTLFKITGAKAYYDDPSGRLKGTLGKPGPDAVKPVSALSSRLGTSVIKAVSYVAPVASTRPAYLQSTEAWRDHLNNLNINDSGQSYPVGNNLVAEWSLIKAAGKEYENILFDYLDSHQYADIGLWEYQNEQDYDPEDNVGYNGTNGLMKICVLYGSLGRPVPNAYNALQSTIKVGLYPNTDPKDETVCYTLNIWTCLSSMIGNIKRNDPANFPAAQKLLAENIPALLETAYDLQHTHLRDDGGFQYYERRTMNGITGCANTPESDTDSTMVATTSTISAIFGTINRVFDCTGTTVPMWCADDYYIFVSELAKAGKVYKNEIPQAELITFNDYVETDVVEGNEQQPHDDITIKMSHQFFTSTIVQKPGTKVDDADLAWRMENLVETEYDEANGGVDTPLKDGDGNYIMAPAPANAYVSIGNTFGTGNCYSFEADILFDAADRGQVLELYFMDSSLGSNYYLSGFAFYGYQNGDDRYVRFYDNYAGADNAKNENIYDKIKVGEWFNIRLELYKVYVENADETQTLEIKIKVFIDDQYITLTDNAFMLNNAINDIEPDKVMLSQYRYRKSVIYFDNIIAEKKDVKYEKEIVHNEVTFDNGTVLSSPSITVNPGAASGTLVNDLIEAGDTEGGNERNYFKVRDDVTGKAGDAVLEVYHKANKKNSGYGVSNIDIGITDGSNSGQIFILEFEMMVEQTPASNFFTRIRIGSTSNSGLYHTFMSDGTNVICQNNKGGNATLGALGEWIHVKMIWYAVNPSNIDLTNPGAPTVEFYLLVYDSEGNENLLTYASLYTSYVASNRALNNVYFGGSENGTTSDQKYFLDNITFIRTAEETVLPAKPATE